MRVGSLDLFKAELQNNNDVERFKQLIHKNSAVKKEAASKTTEGKKYTDADNVAKQFETLFMNMMLKTMRETVKPDDETNAQNIYKSMLDSEYAKNMTDSESFGIRDMVRNWILENS